MELKEHTCCFFGHRKVEVTDELVSCLKDTVIDESYDHTYYPEGMINAGKAAYVERNYGMIDNSSYCVIYYDKNYMPPKRKNSRRDLFDYQPNSGTKLAYDYAVKKGLQVVNIL